MIFRQTSIRRDKSDSDLIIFVQTNHFEKEAKNKFTKIFRADVDFPCQELFNSGLGIVVALLVRPGINVSCVSTGVQFSCSCSLLGGDT